MISGDRARAAHQRIVIDLAVRILRSAMQRSGDVRVDTIEVRLALRCLLHHCPERWPLDCFWEAAAQENEIGRAQGTTAAFNGIVKQLRRAGRYSEGASSRSRTENEVSPGGSPTSVQPPPAHPGP